VDIAALNRAAAIWSVTGYTVPDFRDRLFLSSAHPAAEGEWLDINLTPGRYLIGVRMYEAREAPVMPQLVIDSERIIAAKAIPADANDFLRLLVQRSRWFYLWLQYYVLVMLRYTGPPWTDWVRREFLPVGNAGTRFEFGLLMPGNPLRTKVDYAVFACCKLYVTVYDARSFPIAWRTMTSAQDECLFRPALPKVWPRQSGRRWNRGACSRW
jgi:hypothetical protein